MKLDAYNFGRIACLRWGVTAAQLTSALARQKATGERIGEALCATAALTPEQRDQTAALQQKLRGSDGREAAIAAADAIVAAAASRLQAVGGARCK